MILERAKIAYLKLDELAQAKFFMIPNYHTLVQLHRMMHEIYYDNIMFDIREVYEAMIQFPASGFQCMHHQQQGYIVRLTVNSSLSPTTTTTASATPMMTPISPINHPSSLLHPNFLHSPPHRNSSVFGSNIS
jgi:hypothetical protein